MASFCFARTDTITCRNVTPSCPSDNACFTRTPVKWISERVAHQADDCMRTSLTIARLMYAAYLVGMFTTCQSYEFPLLVVVTSSLCCIYAVFDSYQTAQIQVLCVWLWLTCWYLRGNLWEFMVTTILVRVLCHSNMSRKCQPAQVIVLCGLLLTSCMHLCCTSWRVLCLSLIVGVVCHKGIPLHRDISKLPALRPPCNETRTSVILTTDIKKFVNKQRDIASTMYTNSCNALISLRCMKIELLSITLIVVKLKELFDGATQRKSSANSVDGTRDRERVVFVTENHACGKVPERYATLITGSYSGGNVGAESDEPPANEIKALKEFRKKLDMLRGGLGDDVVEDKLINEAYAVACEELSTLEKINSMRPMTGMTDDDAREHHLKRKGWNVYDRQTKSFLDNDLYTPKAMDRTEIDCETKRVLVWNDNEFEAICWHVSEGEFVDVSKSESRLLLVMDELPYRRGNDYVNRVMTIIAMGYDSQTVAEKVGHLPREYIETCKDEMATAILDILLRKEIPSYNVMPVGDHVISEVERKEHYATLSKHIENDLFATAETFNDHLDKSTLNERVNNFMKVNNILDFDSAQCTISEKVIEIDVPSVEYMICAYGDVCCICLEGAHSVMFEEECGHFFHSECVRKLKNCPTCRQRLNFRRSMILPSNRLTALLEYRAKGSLKELKNFTPVLGEPSQLEIVAMAILNNTVPENILDNIECLYPGLTSRSLAAFSDETPNFTMDTIKRINLFNIDLGRPDNDI